MISGHEVALTTQSLQRAAPECMEGTQAKERGETRSSSHYMHARTRDADADARTLASDSCQSVSYRSCCNSVIVKYCGSKCKKPNSQNKSPTNNLMVKSCGSIHKEPTHQEQIRIRQEPMLKEPIWKESVRKASMPNDRNSWSECSQIRWLWLCRIAAFFG